MDIESIFREQHDYFLHHSVNEGLKDRRKRLKKLRRWVLSNKDQIETALKSDLNKPEVETAISEIKPVLLEIDKANTNLSDWASDKKVPAPLYIWGTRSKIRYQPKGVSLIMSPWNFPFNLTAGPLVSAIAAGCPVIIKPSEFTPATSSLLSKMVEELFSTQEVAVVQGAVDVATELLRLPFHHIYFTGSPQVGKIVMRAASEHLSSVTLELGGENPLIIHKSADLKDAAEKIIWAKTLNAGQSCISPNTAYIPSNLKGKFLQQLTKASKKLLAGDGESRSRIINRKHFARLRELVDDATNHGGELVLGGDYESENLMMEPTVIDEPSIEARILNEEIFGPLLGLKSYSDFDSLLSKLREGHRPLAAYLFARDGSAIKTFNRHIIAGTSAINDTTLQFIHSHLPFGGVNRSGIGKGHGKWGFMEFSNEVSVVRQRRGITMAKLIYPPYTPLKKKLANFLTRWL